MNDKILTYTLITIVAIFGLWGYNIYKFSNSSIVKLPDNTHIPAAELEKQTNDKGELKYSYAQIAEQKSTDDCATLYKKMFSHLPYDISKFEIYENDINLYFDKCENIYITKLNRGRFYMLGLNSGMAAEKTNYIQEKIKYYKKSYDYYINDTDTSFERGHSIYYAAWTAINEGKIYLKIKDYNNALNATLKADFYYKRNPLKFPLYPAYLGDIYMGKGEYEQAYSLYAEALNNLELNDSVDNEFYNEIVDKMYTIENLKPFKLKENNYD